MFLRNQEKGIFSKEFNGLKLKVRDIFNLKFFHENIISKVLRNKKEQIYPNDKLNFKLNRCFNFVYSQIRENIFND